MKVKTSKILGVITLVAAASVPIIVSAQSTGSSMQRGSQQGSQQGGSMQGTQQGGATGQQGSMQQRGAGQQAGAANRPIPINGHFTFPLAASCTYTADVRGNARPARTAGATEPMYVPEVVIDASVACPGQPTIRVRENITGTREMTMTQLEETIELRGSLVTESTGAHCAYVPDFRLTPRAIEGVSAALLCPMPATAARGGGPSEEELRQYQQNQQHQQHQQHQQQQVPAPVQNGNR